MSVFAVYVRKNILTIACHTNEDKMAAAGHISTYYALIYTSKNNDKDCDSLYRWCELEIILSHLHPKHLGIYVPKKG